MHKRTLVSSSHFHNTDHSSEDASSILYKVRATRESGYLSSSVSTKACKLMAEGLLDASSSSAFLRTILLRRILPDDFIPSRLLERLFGSVRDLLDYRSTTTQEATVRLQVCWFAFTKAMPR